MSTITVDVWERDTRTYAPREHEAPARVARFIATVQSNGATVRVAWQEGTLGNALKIEVKVGRALVGQANFDAETGEDLGYWALRTGTHVWDETSRAALLARVRRLGVTA